AKWNDNGEGVFHRDCWAKLSDGAYGRSADLELSELEIKLVKEARKTAEYHDSDDYITAEAKRIAQMIRNADYPVFFTGAGISTAAGIGDFRGKDGKWTERDKLKEHGTKGAKKAYKKTPLRDLRPTYTHEAIRKLVDMGIFKFVISQNTDGIHRLSCIPASKMAELHGNAYVQKCEKCGTRYDVGRSHRDAASQAHNVPPKKCERCGISHRTGRMCEKKDCGGYLMNTIINFGDYLEEQVLDAAQEHARKGDIFMCLGSTLMVSPANSLVMSGKSPHRLVICNRQATEYDTECERVDEQGVRIGSRIHGDCDKLMKALMVELLGDEAVRDWEDGREARLLEYDEMRR
ncbi:SIR1-like protein, partial [Mya arenaria]